MTNTSPLRPEDPERLGRYRMLGRLGQGGQGVVLLGEDPEGRRVAVKLLHAHPEQDSAQRRRFVQELAAAKRVARFCTAQVLDADLAGDRPYIVSEYVEGPSLSRAVAEDGPMADGALERLAIGTATALVAIHQAGLVHRDFKPHNVLLGGDGPRVIDFGIAKALDAAATVTSGVVGTPAYMAPEQMGGGVPVGPAADVFAWGVTMAFAANGTPPFGQDTIPAVMGRILHGEPALGGLDGLLRDLVAQALAKDPAERPTSMGLLHRLLGQDGQPAASEVERRTSADGLLAEGRTHAAALNVTAPRGGASATRAGALPGGAQVAAGPEAPRSGRRRRLLRGLAAAVLVVLFAGGGYAAYQQLGDGDDDGAASEMPSPDSQGLPGESGSGVDPTGPASPAASPSARRTAASQKVIVPDLRGLQELAARRAAADAGLVLPDVSSEGGRVVRQIPAAGTRAPRGTVIKVTWRF
ncbi:serine/threonine protein kinase [Actinomadura macrotermitis]|uniref:non-specific serine/threonine protein kinase n=1 Tax=Actinomadura macrotermitis TaxID=2585200 RepID=A0A7K0C334_9ACTN|nr:serine/threonine protein kinase [Actinomadura macrotermitis]MQY07859.1 Serine/threonine-protein kinase PknD [Actinomadura macrotermitis]